MKTIGKCWVCLTVVAMVMVSASVYGQGGGGYRHYRDRSHDKNNVSARNDSKKIFSTRIYRITEADSVQQIKMKPAVEKASKRLETLRLNYQKQEKRVLDSLGLQLKPILKEDQYRRLEDFNYHHQERLRK